MPIAPAWRGQLEAAGFRLDEDEDGLPVSVGVQHELRSIIGVADSLGAQAKRAGHWIDEHLGQLERVAPQTEPG
jgi:hypothetical protein